jgi:hypothetical protein
MVHIARGESCFAKRRSQLKKQHAERVRVIHCLVFGFSLVLLVACLTSSVQASSPITSSGLNTQVGQPITLPSGQTQYDITD